MIKDLTSTLVINLDKLLEDNKLNFNNIIFNNSEHIDLLIEKWRYEFLNEINNSI